ncbi:MAG: sigma-70 family RNA polymerase sigma factor [Bacilli bacterium]|nr:sigma-70 family RNA polymerase sigma factor [Bacilli bacterium]
MNKEMLESFEPLIRAIASKFYNIEYDDLLQAGRIGLINAYQHYDKNSNTKFSSFAYTYIFGEMYNLALTSKSIKTNKDTLKLSKLIEKTKIYLTQLLGKSPSIEEISSYLEIDESTIYNTINASLNILSLDRDSEEENNLYDILSKEEDNDTKLDIESSLQELTDKEQNIIMYRYYNDLTQQETAKIMGISQVSVSRYEQKSLKKLKNVMSS